MSKRTTILLIVAAVIVGYYLSAKIGTVIGKYLAPL